MNWRWESVPTALRSKKSLADIYFSQKSRHAFTPASFFVDFLRYAPSDPLCCASRTTVVQYRVEQRDGKPVVVPLEAETGKNGS